MQIKKEYTSSTKLKMTVEAVETDLRPHYDGVLKKLSASVKISGFRPGKAPLELVARHLDYNTLSNEFLNQAVDKLADHAFSEQHIRVVKVNEISVKKFVPYTDLEFVVDAEVVGEISLGDYKNLGLSKPKITVSAKEVSEVIDQFSERAAERQESKKPAVKGDEVIIDFVGKDSKGKIIDNTEGKDQPLVIGSNSFIPGFEDQLIGLKAKDAKDFKITFPKDYGATELAGKAVTFSVEVKKINKLVKPELDDEFAKTINPNVKTIDEFKEQLKNEIRNEKEDQETQKLNNEVILKVIKLSKVDVPKILVDDEIDKNEAEEKRNLVYRGMTWQEHLKEEGVTEKEHHEKQRPNAENSVKAGILIGAIAEKENIQVTNDELEMQLSLLKGRYINDQNMMQELDKPETIREIWSRLMSAKTLDYLRSFVK